VWQEDEGMVGTRVLPMVWCIFTVSPKCCNPLIRKLKRGFVPLSEKEEEKGVKS
jgi:hypothetical protein